MHANDSAKANQAENSRSSARAPTGRAATPLLALQGSVGNAAVVQMLRRTGHLGAQDRHQHSAGGGRRQTEQPVQRSTVDDVLRTPGRSLDEATRADMEARLGADFSDVRVHTDATARASATEIGARAYTAGNHVVIGTGGGDRRTLAHELTHVIQQRRGPVAGTDHGDGLRVSDPSDRFEREAEANARRALSGPAPAHGPGTGRQPGAADRAVGAQVQRTAAADGAGLPVVQRWTDGTMTGDAPTFVADHGRAGTVEVHNLEGTPLGDGANFPKVEPVGWAQLRQEGFTKSAPGGEKPVGAPYRAVRMHLFNGRLGGPGNDVRNLAPGPGKLNSMMSAQAETPAKLLVELGHKVWLRTTVSYQDDNVNASNPASTVPNHITMEWGVENDQASRREWSSPINLPVAPLDATQAARYQTWSDTPAQLVQDMRDANISDQMRAQVLGLVPDDQLKLALLREFPSLYFGSESADQARYILLHDTVADRSMFLWTMGMTLETFFPQALQPLYREGHRAEAEELFRNAGVPDHQQREMAFQYGEEMLLAVGAAGFELVERLGAGGQRLLKYFSASDQMLLFDNLDIRGGLGALLHANSPGDRALTEAERNRLLDCWAVHRGHSEPDDKKDFIERSSIVPAHKTEYGRWLDRQAAFADYQERRPPRRAAAAGANR